jgi:mannose-1-phosphate guanylyltransferase/phosphomannomutase
MQQLNTLLLAAGKSSRIESIANGLPKPLIPIAGDPIIFRNLRWINRFSQINLVWINTHYEHELMQREIKNFSPQVSNLQLKFVFEKNILGTAGALKNISSCCLQEFHHLVIYGDNLFNFNLSDFIAMHFIKENKVSIALFDDRKNVHTGIAGGTVILDDHFRVTKFIEGEKHPSSHYVNAGVYLLSPEISNYIPSNQFCDFGKDVFPKLLLENVPLHGYIIEGYCLGLDTPDCFAVANELTDQKKVELL